MSDFRLPPTLLFVDRTGQPIDASSVFVNIEKPCHEAFHAPSGAGMSFNSSKEIDDE